MSRIFPLDKYYSTPDFQVEVALHFLQMRSPIQELKNSSRHLRHFLFVVSDVFMDLDFFDTLFILPFGLGLTRVAHSRAYQMTFR